MIKNPNLNLTLRARKSYQADSISCLAFTLFSLRQDLKTRSKGFFLSLALAPEQGALKTWGRSLIKTTVIGLLQPHNLTIAGRKPQPSLKKLLGAIQ